MADIGHFFRLIDVFLFAGLKNGRVGGKEGQDGWMG